MTNDSNKRKKIKRYWNLFLKYLQDCGKTSSFHGANHLAATNRHILEKIFWMLALVMAAFFLFKVNNNLLHRYNTSPTVISIDRDQLSWNITFPAATFCVRDVEEDALEEVAKEFNATEDDHFKTFLRKIINVSMDSITDENIKDHPLVSPEKYLNISSRIIKKLQGDVSFSHPIKLAIEKTSSEFGLCYAINSQVSTYNSPQYWKENRWDTQEPKELAEAHLLDEAVYIKMSYFFVAYDLYIHDSHEIPKFLDKNFGADNGTSSRISFKLLATVYSEDLNSLSLTQRKCRFLHEKVLLRSPVYTYNSCIVECRVNKILELCGCVPHFYRNLPGERICRLSELKCIHIFKTNILLASSKKLCKCLPLCQSNFYTVSEQWIVNFDLYNQMKFTVEYPKYRLKREILYTLTDLLVNWGGAAGLMLGCSVLTLMEIVYFVFVRSFWFYCFRCRRV